MPEMLLHAVEPSNPPGSRLRPTYHRKGPHARRCKLIAPTNHTSTEQKWVYIRSETDLWTVGFYRPDGTWQPESDHDSPEKAAKRTHYLNGGEN